MREKCLANKRIYCVVAAFLNLSEISWRSAFRWSFRALECFSFSSNSEILFRISWDWQRKYLHIKLKLYRYCWRGSINILYNQNFTTSNQSMQSAKSLSCKLCVCVLSACLFSGEVWWGVEEEDGGQEEDKEGEGDQQDPPVPRTRHPAMWIESTLRLYTTSGVDQNPSVSELYGLIRIS